MQQLLDTHTFIWFILGSSRFSNSLRSQIENNDNFLSIASIWEMAIKHSIGKLNFNLSFAEFVDQQIIMNCIQIINIEIEHILTVSQLPLHHRDPFDRMLIAQAIVENLPILSADTIFDTYPVKRLW
ncbi:type II toxin-antitoxin system VapC family toxin [Nostoc sp. FACHB-87]|uniref:type II toxin-antitoxin system VapC family toxin n=1 Tax=Nostocaceae TaxID=1162 RepID=UPI001683AF6D|nr:MULTISPECIES: PIN domain-containing protein [Nostocaceae]MBD2453576.1 type II toxin-antitoxin system VapC family toxin [Nostoc sp. FACHB-87]MBD2475701.1 type II toxin-antitoxin system VapC family toxin [Anabaena sp. FACHB-83]